MNVRRAVLMLTVIIATIVTVNMAMTRATAAASSLNNPFQSNKRKVTR